MYEKGLQLGGTIANILAALGQAHALNGRTDRARELLQQLHEMSSSASRTGCGTSAVPAPASRIVQPGLGKMTAHSSGWKRHGAASDVFIRAESASGLRPSSTRTEVPALLVRLGLSQASLNERSRK